MKKVKMALVHTRLAAADLPPAAFKDESGKVESLQGPQVVLRCSSRRAGMSRWKLTAPIEATLVPFG